MSSVTATRRILMLLAASFAIAGALGLVLIALRVFTALPAWCGPVIGCFISLALILVVAAFYISDEPARTRGGTIITKKSDPVAYRTNFFLLLAMGGMGLLYFLKLLIAALRTHT